MSHKRNSGYVEGYVDGNNRLVEPFNQNIGADIQSDPVPPSLDGGFVEGYVDGGERTILPFNPNQEVIEEIIIVPPAATGGTFFVQYVQNVNATTADGDLFISDTFSFLPVTECDIWITVNGLSIYPANGSSEASVSAFYITDSTGTIVRPKGQHLIGDLFHWNGSIANYQIEADDEIKIIYEV